MGHHAEVKFADYVRLVALGAIWGASFLFMRIAAPSLGPFATAFARLALGGLALLAWFRWTGFEVDFRRHWKPFLAIGVLNSALPYVLYSFAAMHAPVPVLAITNATTPMFSLAFGALLAGERVSPGRLLGLALGVAGVALIVGPQMHGAGPLFPWAIAASLLACCSYGLTGVTAQRFSKSVPSNAIAAGSQLMAALLIVPLLPTLPPTGPWTPAVIVCTLALGLLASAVALVLYFRLVADCGATRALSVTYLVPLFGVLWGWLVLDETLPADALLGGVLVLAGTALVTRGNVRR